MNKKTVALILRVWTVCGLGVAALWVVFGADLVSAEYLPKTGRVKAVFDGDTVLLESGERVRYRGIDAPEVAHKDVSSDCYGEQARAANRCTSTLRGQNRDLRDEARRLREDPATIESVARQELGLIRKGEILVVVRPARR